VPKEWLELWHETWHYSVVVSDVWQHARQCSTGSANKSSWGHIGNPPHPATVHARWQPHARIGERVDHSSLA
jgi:hypothetical protein